MCLYMCIYIRTHTHIHTLTHTHNIAWTFHVFELDECGLVFMSLRDIANDSRRVAVRSGADVGGEPAQGDCHQESQARLECRQVCLARDFHTRNPAMCCSALLHLQCGVALCAADRMLTGLFCRHLLHHKSEVLRKKAISTRFGVTDIKCRRL